MKPCRARASFFCWHPFYFFLTSSKLFACIFSHRKHREVRKNAPTNKLAKLGTFHVIVRNTPHGTVGSRPYPGFTIFFVHHSDRGAHVRVSGPHRHVHRAHRRPMAASLAHSIAPFGLWRTSGSLHRVFGAHCSMFGAFVASSGLVTDGERLQAERSC